jgi:hypothetical protein
MDDSYNTSVFERVTFGEVQPGDRVFLPSAMWEGEPVGWNTVKGYNVERVEERAPSVVFIWRAAEDFPPKTTYDRFIMVCGDRVAAGVLRVKRSSVKTVPATDLKKHNVLCGDDGRPFAVVNDVKVRKSGAVWTSTYGLDDGAAWLPVSFPAGSTAVVLDEDSPKFVHVVLVTLQDGTELGFPTCFDDACDSPIVETQALNEPKTLSGVSRRLGPANCTTCGASL